MILKTNGMLKKGKNKTIFGVCSGLADYLGIDVTIVRVGFAVTALFYGVAIIVYLILAVAMPDADT